MPSAQKKIVLEVGGRGVGGWARSAVSTGPALCLGWVCQMPPLRPEEAAWGTLMPWSVVPRLEM